MNATASHASVTGGDKNGAINEAANGALNVEEPHNNLPRNSAVLSSWKEIATYLGRGVRTVQRWERNADLPVRRPNGANRGPVLAIPGELDRWISRSSSRPSLPNAKSATENLAAKLADLARTLLTEGERLLLLSEQKSPEMQKALASLRAVAAEVVSLDGEGITTG